MTPKQIIYATSLAMGIKQSDLLKPSRKMPYPTGRAICAKIMQEHCLFSQEMISIFMKRTRSNIAHALIRLNKDIECYSNIRELYNRVLDLLKLPRYCKTAVDSESQSAKTV